MYVISDAQMKQLTERYPEDSILKEVLASQEETRINYALSYAKKHLMGCVYKHQKVTFVKALREASTLSLKEAVDIFNTLETDKLDMAFEYAVKNLRDYITPKDGIRFITLLRNHINITVTDALDIYDKLQRVNEAEKLLRSE